MGARKGSRVIVETTTDPSLRNGAEAIRLAKGANRLSADKPIILRILAAAYAETGNFLAATQTAERALALANVQGETALADSLRKEIALYRADSPYRKTSKQK